MFAIDDGRLTGESESLRVEVDATTGSLLQLTNRLTGQQLCDPDDAGPPWRILEQGTLPSVIPAPEPSMGFRLTEVEPTRCDIEVHEESASLVWQTTSPGIEVRIRLEFTSSGNLEMWPLITCSEGTAPPAHLFFPTLAPAALSNNDRLLFPAHSGWLISDPLESISEGVYPDGFHGLSVQVMAYFVPGEGGFYMACHDPFVTHKKLTFGDDEVSFRHDTWDLREGTDVEYGYPVVFSALQTGTWFEAAEKYREWALGAPWSQNGKNSERAGETRPKWLFEEVGLSIWGTPSSLDWSKRYEILGSLAGSPLHIVSGWDWPATRPHYVGKEGWFPARFHPANLEAWKDHYVTPYMNDLFISNRAPDFIEHWEPNLIFPYKTFSFTYFSERSPEYAQGRGSGGDPNVMTDVDFYVCPCTPAQQELHTWRDARLVGDYALDGVFYDISSGNPFAARCLRSFHGHAPGWSREVLQAYATNNASSREAMREATGRVPAQGVETIVEHVIGDIDFYVSRSVAGPVGGLEAFTLGPETPPGEGRELVPLFQAIYHQVGPVHEDGWLTFDGTYGDIFYWIAARLTVVWGGILSLHYANNPPEAFDGAGPGEVISWDGGYHVFEDLEPVEPGFARFAADLGKLRLGIGNPYLAYGSMLSPLELDVPHTDLRYHRSNAVLTGVARSGEWNVPAVVSGAWEAEDGKIGLFLVNVSDTPVHLETTTETDWPISNGDCRTHGADGVATLRDRRLTLDLTLPSRVPVAVEVEPK